MRVLVCGGREYGMVPRGCPWDQRVSYARRASRQRFLLTETLRVLCADRGITCVIHGAYKGADELADQWAAHRGIPVERFPADWKGRGRKAGPERNQRMIDQGHPDLVVAFPGGDGTADMMRRARAAGIEVIEVEQE